MYLSLSTANINAYQSFLSGTTGLGSFGSGSGSKSSSSVLAANLSSSANTGGGNLLDLFATSAQKTGINTESLLSNYTQKATAKKSSTDGRTSLVEQYGNQTLKYKNLKKSLINNTGGELETGISNYVGSGNDTLNVTGNGGKALGGAGDDTINATNVSGGFLASHSGNDTINLVNTRSTFVSAGTGNDAINLSLNSTGNTIHAGDGNDTISTTLDSFANTYFGSTGTDTLDILDGESANFTAADNGDGTYTLNDTLNGTSATLSSIENITFANGTFTIEDIVNGAGGGTGISGSDGTSGGNITLTNYDDTVTFTGNNNTIDALDGDDTITLNGTGNTVDLNDGNDTVTIANNNNTVAGGLGNDTVNVANGVNGTTVSGGAGTDTVTFTGNFADYSFSFRDDDNQVSVTDSFGNTTIVAGDVENFQFADGTKNFNSMLTNASDSTIEGTAGSDTYTNSGDNNTFNLGNGTNTVNLSGTGNTVYGGNGTDNVNLSVARDSFTFTDNGNGTYTLDNGSTSLTIDDNVDSVTFTNGTMSIAEIQSAASGGPTEGDDTVYVGGTGQTINALGGNDTIEVNYNTANHNTIAGGSGTDTVKMMNDGSYMDVNTITASDNGDGTVTLTDSVTGNHNTFSKSDVEYLDFNQGSYTLDDLLNGLSSTEYVSGTYYGTNAGDSVTLGGSNQNLYTYGSDDRVRVDLSGSNNFIDFGDGGNDTLILSGNQADYTITDNGNGTITFEDASFRSVTIANAEYIEFADGASDVGSLNYGGGSSIYDGITRYAYSTGASTWGSTPDSNMAFVGDGNANTLNISNSTAINNLVLDGGGGNDTLNIGTDYTLGQLYTTQTNIKFVGGSGTDTLNIGKGSTGMGLGFTIGQQTFDEGTFYSLTNTTTGEVVYFDNTVENIGFTGGAMYSLAYMQSNIGNTIYA